MIEKNEITPIINYLANSKLKSVIANNSLKIIWCSDNTHYSHLLGADLSCIFEDGFVIPENSCTCKGMLHGIPYYYNLIRYNEFYVVEIMSSNMLSDFETNSIPISLLKKSEVEIRSSVANICTHTSILYDILKNLKCTDEIDYLNLQRGNCYKILNSLSTPVEMTRYSNPQLHETSSVSVKEVFTELQDAFSVLGNTEDLTFTSPENVFINAHKERFTYVLIELLSKFAEAKTIKAEVLAEEVDGFIYISVRRDGSVPAHESYKLFSDADSSLGNLDIDFILTNLFCHHFSGEFYLSRISNKVIACTLKIPKAVPDKKHLIFRSPEKQYGNDSFSPVRIAFADLYDYRHYEIPDYPDDEDDDE